MVSNQHAQIKTDRLHRGKIFFTRSKTAWAHILKTEHVKSKEFSKNFKNKGKSRESHWSLHGIICVCSSSTSFNRVYGLCGTTGTRIERNDEGIQLRCKINALSYCVCLSLLQSFFENHTPLPATVTCFKEVSCQKFTFYVRRDSHSGARIFFGMWVSNTVLRHILLQVFNFKKGISLFYAVIFIAVTYWNILWNATSFFVWPRDRLIKQK